ncbi:MAG TPA: 1-(5-phosphoribosyl)-5-[(5-phosphoribosylamino)methylideneamino]imidazole-4-carboxamide isomerase [Kouleothrix sp.]|uniref:1-(5-phosphoribosyl)-5-[(5- phosphoribosylamino)methylideneamino]imidazole-4- carboxamide isomerase n=1 Tax=Kouleothrix sp. TaxID=2779161 RepID=UPI002C5A9AD6|nr:1-(5-phosphoribosyl)-5-[(5-phosphoribosylamino)methylideneamino]imidazole-4-carboxamide isomerase [Kouleothrix sp.]HRC74678.1 1-(5-phosphoribosyl)-5-[(5-phosphoribosylamino)methylideneamino]imidazole-4-carboxamide isomerase [Kouleothrix sp.]
MDIIPAIDIKDGKCVRLYQGDFARMTIYDHDPAAVAQRWEAQGARMLHVVDLDGARAGHPVNTDIILAIVQSVSVPVQIGGGLRDEKAVLAALGLGVSRVVLGTAAVEQPELIARLVERYGDEIAIGVDARDGIVATAGWVEQSQVTATALIDHMAALGVRHVIYTDIARDGTLSEPNFAAIGALVQHDGPAIVASGGVGNVAHLRRLAALGVEAAIVGKALYTGNLSLPEALAALR